MSHLTVLILCCLYALSHQDEATWSYDFETLWPGVCTTGGQQSPINIMTRDAVLDLDGAHIRGPLVFRGYRGVSVKALNNGHTLRWNYSDKSPAPVISGGPLRGNYTFMQFHLHWLSEHAIDGIKYPLEIHLVHIKTGLTLEEAVQRPDGLAVVGVMAELTDEEDSTYALEQILPIIPKLADKGATQSTTDSIDLTRLLSDDPQSYFTYHGSLTTPLCQEVVTWIVMDKPLSISSYQYKIFDKVDVGGLENYRGLQRINRVVYRSIASCSYAIAPSLLSSLAAMFTCVSYKLSHSFGSGFNKGLCYVINLKRKLFGNVLKECNIVAGF